MTRRDRALLWIARWALREMSNKCAWWLHQSMIEAYRQRPDLARED